MFFDFEKFYKLKLPKYKTFLDVGANEGVWFSKIRKKYPNSRIYAVEPIKNITKNKKSIVFINKAVDLQGGLNKNFYITREKVTSSLLK